jgi:hypothetical protein
VQHWKLKEVVLDMETLKEDKKFYFSTSENFERESNSLFFFARMKRERQISAAQQESIVFFISN